MLGSIAFITILFADYTKLKRYSKHLYFLTLLLLLYTLLTRNTINGQPQFLLGSWYFNIFAIAPYLLIVSLAGIFAEWNWNARYSVLKIFAFFAPPLLLLMAGNNKFAAFLYLVGFLVLFFSTQVKKRIILSFMGIMVPAVVGMILLTTRRYQIDRYLAFLDPYADPHGSGYLLVQSMKALSSAGLWGNGFGSRLDVLPAIESDFIFTYLVYSFGLVTGAALVLIGIILFARLLRATKLVKDRYGFLLLSGWMAVFFTPYFWSIFMTIGLVPPTSATLPFVSNGIVHLVLQMALIGLVLNVYRRKDIMQLTKQ
ncbi:FtsW/RodA/SpoVE family cell cycle protein [uncultured Brevibacillus sp.]|uniref:FtsW/RodA/SpoVE family cell cycle protein n=1 Tax=uncultured Brevibacillus sp. TaxID=169970 RepID=UPI002598D36D|nr:FtsW/RodA/SpoVE family cell cycle protein [uncultured Brevibacillus sp.]